MAAPDSESTNKTGSRFKKSGVVLLAVLFLALLLLVALIPYHYQSQSILYKFGLDKTVLRFGKIAGLWAALLLFLQIIPAARLTWLDSLFSRKQQLLFHQWAGGALAVLALVHPLLVFWPEDLKSLAVDFRYWPEVIGGFLLLLIWMILATARLRNFLGMNGLVWMRLHRLLTGAAVLGVTVHTLTVSDTFTKPVPRFALIVFLMIFVLLWLKIRLGMLLKNRADKKKSTKKR